MIKVAVHNAAEALLVVLHSSSHPWANMGMNDG
jgi:hypothetical protein